MEISDSSCDQMTASRKPKIVAKGQEPTERRVKHVTSPGIRYIIYREDPNLEKGE